MFSLEIGRYVRFFDVDMASPRRAVALKKPTRRRDGDDEDAVAGGRTGARS